MTQVSLTAARASIGGRRVLDDVTLSVAAGEMVAVCGPNGAGKTSVLRAALGLLRLEAGEAALGGRPVATLDPAARAAAAAWLPQDRRVAWNMPAVEVAALGAPFLDPAAAQARALAALDEVEAGPLAHRGVADMSGGERARVLIARAFAAPAAALLVDEPAAGLDPQAQLLVMERLRDRARAGQAVLVTLHDLTLAVRHADRVIVIDGGAVAADAAPRDALSETVLAGVFGLHGVWLSSSDGPVLSVSRATTSR